MYFDASETEEPLAVSRDLQVAISLNGLAVLGLGLFPGGLLAVCAAVLA
jgi:NADH-quinone oxidoreductase subunit N